MRRPAFTLIEMLVVIAIMGTLVGLLLPAIQRARDAAMRSQCANNLHQIGLGLHHYHDSSKVFPSGLTPDRPGQPYPWMTWLTRLLPYIEQQALADQTQSAYQQDRSPFDDPPHGGYSTPLPTFACPSDERVSRSQTTYFDFQVALTSYVGVNGTDYTRKDGVLYPDSQIRLTDITDGTSTTLMAGERPPSTDFWYGWWYAAVSQHGSGSPDVLLGVRELNQNANFLWPCAPGPYHFQAGKVGTQCDVLHFWSTHFAGAHFLFADGSVHFLGFGADSVLPALATRNGGESITVP